MTNAQSIRIAGKYAIIAALMGSSSLAFAQDAAPVTVAPPTPSPVAAVPSPAPVIVPPPAVSTLPSANDVVNAAAAQEAAAETSERRSVAATPRAAPTVRPVTRLAPAAPTPVVNVEPNSAVTPTPVEAAQPIAPAIGPTLPTPVAVDEVTPAADTANAQSDTISAEDVTLIGGIAAALAAIGLGAAFASRRKRKVIADQPQMDAHRDFVAPAPIKQDPAFQQFAAKTAALAPTTVAPIGQRTVQPKPVVTRPDIPVTDPLFSRTVVQTPITDPLFAPRNDVAIPVTDPMFAHLSEYSGNSANSKSAWAYDNRQNRKMTGQVNERAPDEMEPAE
jgi:DNA polymerase III subunit gamma/tau